MTRKLDIEIARLDGVDVDPSYPGRGVPHYSEDLNALMELIRRRWPGCAVILSPNAADILLATGELFSGEGDTDVERLAHAVKQALEAEA